MVTCKRRLHLLKLCGHHVEGVRDPLRCHCGSAFEFPARVQRGSVDDVVVGCHSFFFELLSAENQTLLVWSGAVFDLQLALDVVNRVGLFTSNVIGCFAS